MVRTKDWYYQNSYTYAIAFDINERQPQTAKGDSSAEDALRVSSSAASYHVIQGSTTHQPTPMGNKCSSSHISYKNYGQIKKH